jgi:hypothetical protein
MVTTPEPRRAIPVLVLALAVGGCAHDAADIRPALAATTLAPVEYSVSEDAVRLVIEIRFHEARTLTAARVLLDRATPVEVGEPIRLGAGESVRLETVLTGDCPDPPRLPVFEITTEGQEGSRVNRFLPFGDADFEASFTAWCQREVSGSGGLRASAARRIPAR